MARRKQPSTKFYADNIPDRLRAEYRWLCWQPERDSAGRITKVPINPNAPSWARRKDSEEARKARRRGSSTNPDTWTAFSVATKIASREGHGIGFAVEGSGIVGIDLDHVIRADGSLDPWAQDVVKTLDSYTEISPSGDGIRIFAAGVIPKALKPSGVGLEMYATGRYLTVTGERWPGTRGEVEERAAEIQAIYEMYVPASTSTSDKPVTQRETTLGDDEILRGIARSKQAEKFEQLFESNDSIGYGSPSEGDFALALILAFWCGNDETQIEGLMRSSNRVRDKWFTKRGSRTWLQYTIRNAVQKNTQVYEPRRSRPLTWAQKLTLKLAQAEAGEAA